MRLRSDDAFKKFVSLCREEMDRGTPELDLSVSPASAPAGAQDWLDRPYQPGPAARTPTRRRRMALAASVAAAVVLVTLAAVVPGLLSAVGPLFPGSSGTGPAPTAAVTLPTGKTMWFGAVREMVMPYIEGMEQYPVLLHSREELDAYYERRVSIKCIVGEDPVNYMPHLPDGWLDIARMAYDDEATDLLVVYLPAGSRSRSHTVVCVSRNGGALNIDVSRSDEKEPDTDSVGWCLFIPVEKGAADGARLAVRLNGASVSGEEASLPFTAAYYRTQSLADENQYTTVIRSRDELEAFYGTNGEWLDSRHAGQPDTWLEAAAAYDNAFFSENDLVLAFVKEASGSYRHEIASVVRTERRLFITVNRRLPTAATDDIAGWCLFIGLEKGATDGIRLTVLMNDVNENIMDTSLPFTAGYFRTQWLEDMDQYDTVLRSRSELEAFYGTRGDWLDSHHSGQPGTWLAAAAAYDDAFFSGRDLVLAFIEQGSGSIRHEVASVIQTDGGILITVNCLTPAVGTCDMAGWCLFVAVDKGAADSGVDVRSARLSVNGQYADGPYLPVSPQADLGVEAYQSMLREAMRACADSAGKDHTDLWENLSPYFVEELVIQMQNGNHLLPFYNDVVYDWDWDNAVVEAMERIAPNTGIRATVRVPRIDGGEDVLEVVFVPRGDGSGSQVIGVHVK